MTYEESKNLPFGSLWKYNDVMMQNTVLVLEKLSSISQFYSDKTRYLCYDVKSGSTGIWFFPDGPWERIA